MARNTPTAPTTRHRVPPLAVVVLVAGLALLAAACSSKSGSASTSGASSSTTQAGATSSSTAAAGATDVAVATTSLGPVVVNAKGMTLYTYAKDTGTTATCTGACARAWPPATVTGTPSASAAVTGTLTVNSAGQLVLDGHPLYTYAADTAAGDVNGQGVGGVWFAVKADGSKAG